MKSAHKLLHWRYLLVVVLVLGSAMTGAAPVFAVTGTATSAATPSNTTPSVPGQITVAININMSGVSAPDSALGSFTGTLDWNTAVLNYTGNTGIGAGFTGNVNITSAGSGHIVFNGANSSGATGNLNVLSITFDVVAAGTSALNLEYSAMAAATSFANLLPNLTITDGSVTAGGAASHTVTFNSNGGTGTMSSQTANVPTALTTNAFTRAGYTFSGWNTAVGGGGTPYANGASYSFAADITLYAQWTALASHTVTFNSNGGTGTMSPQTANVPTALTTNAFTRAGYTFSGWNTAVGGGGTPYANGASYSFAADITLYAQWSTQPNRTVTFNSNGGTGTMSPQTANVPTALTTNAFTRAGYTFNGWNTAVGGGGTPYADGASYSFAADITLYAQWTALASHTVTFNSNGGTGTMSPQTANVPTALTTNAFTRAGYTFSGWNTAVGGGGTPYANGASYSFAADITLYAQWTALANYTLSVAVSPTGAGTTNPTVGDHTYASGSVVAVTATPVAGYTFSSWSGACTGTGACSVTMDAAKSVTANFTVQSGSVVSAATPSNATPSVGQQVVVSINIDMSGVAGTALGSFTGSLAWNPAVLAYNSNSGIGAGFTGAINIGSVGSGSIAFNGANTTGATGNNIVLTITFDVVGGGTSSLDLGYSVMAAASTFANLLPLLTVTDGQVVASGPALYTLTTAVSPAGGGTTNPAAGPHNYASGTVVAVTATPAAGYTFTSWSGACTGTGTCSVTMSAARTVTANFTQITYNLTTAVSPSGGGTINPAAGVRAYASGTVVAVTATPAAGYTFTSWSGACTGSGTCSVTMSAARTVTANFTAVNYNLTTAVSPSGGGTINPAAGVRAYASGTVVAVTATPATGYTFTSWTGACTGTGTCSVTMDGNKTVTANFTQITYNLTTAVSPSGGGTINPAAGVRAYASGTVVAVTATPAAGYTFTSWSGACTGTGTCSVTMSAARTVTANFTAQTGSVASAATPSNATPSIGQQIVVTINIDMSGASAPNNALGSFTGSLAWNPAVLTYNTNSGLQAGFTGAINIGSVGTGSIAFNGANTTGATGNIAVLTITFNVVGAGTSALDLGYSAMAAASTFTNLLPILTINDGQVVAQYTLTTAVSPAGGGTINPATGGYPAGTVVAVTATPAAGYTFTSWTGACTGAGTCAVTMDADKTVTANFTQITYNLTTAVSPTGGGTIDPAAGPHIYASGAVVNVTATPATGYTFTSWSGACTGAGACAVTMDADKTVTANFTLISYNLTTAVSPAGGGTTDPAVGVHAYTYGTVVAVTATPAAGYAFSSWSGACTGAGACAVTMDADKTVTANFTQITYILTVAVSPSGGGTTNPTVGPHTYAYATVVNVTATPAAGYVFTSWTGACTGTGASAVTMDADKTVTANFTQIITYNLTTAVSPSGGGTIDPAAGVHAYAAGTVVAVTATPAAGYVFSSWSGACTGAGACAVTMDAAKTVTANFTQITSYNLTTAVSPAGGGTINPAVGVHAYAVGTIVFVTATPAAGYAFSSWSGACTGAGACSVTMDADKTVTANFTLIKRLYYLPLISKN